VQDLSLPNANENDADEPVYAFLHPTFQGYFAALAIDDWDDFLPRTHVDRPVQNRTGECRYRVFEPQWKEAFLLWLNIVVEGLVKTRGGVGAVPPRRGSTPAPRPNQLFDCYRFNFSLLVR
jgi:hypothetical protein